MNGVYPYCWMVEVNAVYYECATTSALKTMIHITNGVPTFTGYAAPVLTVTNACITQYEYILTITSAHGAVTKSPSQATYHEGDVVQLTATPATGWSFASWSGALTSSTNPASITIHGNTAITANYTQNEYALTIASTHGTIAKNPDQATYHEGDVVQLTATPATGWSLANWSGDLTSSTNPASITIHGNTVATANYTPIVYTLSFQSIGAQDGWVLESSKASNKGGTANNKASTLYLGDSAAKQQYRSILSFSTGLGLPDGAVITSLTLKLKKQAILGGGNPFTTFLGLMVDVKKGFFGTSALLQTDDFQAAASKTYGPFKPALVGGWYSINLPDGALAYINNSTAGAGLTQMRLRFKLDDNNNAIANILSLYSGNAGAANWPQLAIKYYVP